MLRGKMFLNREEEIIRIKEVLDLKKAYSKAILIYGLRRVGKSTLIKEALSNYEGTVISYLAVDDTFDSNLRQFAAVAAMTLNMPYLNSVNDITAILSFIASTGRKIVIVLDEYPLLKKRFQGGNLDSYFQRSIDSLPDNLTFIFCGSYLSTMKKMSEYDEPLYGRFDLELHLKTFDYLDSSAFYENLSPYEKVAYYSVFGGFPFVLERLRPEKGLEWNIKRAFLDRWDAVYSTINEILLTEISKLEYSSAILSYLKNGKSRNNEIASAINTSTSVVSKELSRLIEMDLIEKNNPINRKDDAKKTFYEISDNLLRFFYTFVIANRNYIFHYGADATFDNLVAPQLNAYVSRRFERIVKEYITRMIKERREKSFIETGTYWYDLPKQKKNGEFDVVIKLQDGYTVIECKFLKEKMSLSMAIEEEKKIHSIEELEVKKIGFANPNGFDFSAKNGDYLLFSGEDFYYR